MNTFMNNYVNTFLTQKQISKERLTHYIMSFVGGFLGTYALLLRGGTFGNAQTGNLLDIIIDINEGNMPELFIRIGSAVIFSLSLCLNSVLTNHSQINMRKWVPITEMVVLIFASMIPLGVNPIVALYPIFFVSSFQWGTFAGADGYGCATIFSTNNLKQSVTAFTEYVITKEDKYAKKAIFYSVTILAFLLGAAAGCFSVFAWSVKGILALMLPLLMVAVIG